MAEVDYDNSDDWKHYVMKNDVFRFKAEELFSFLVSEDFQPGDAEIMEITTPMKSLIATKNVEKS